MRRVLLAIGVVAVLVIVGLVLAAGRSSSPSASNSPSASASVNTSPSQSPAQSAATITYDSSGFHPAMTTVKSGEAVTFVNNSSEEIQVDSDPHPVHTDDTDLNVGSIAPGQSVTVTLTKKGTFGFHNHLDPSKTARITIQ